MKVSDDIVVVVVMLGMDRKHSVKTYRWEKPRQVDVNMRERAIATILSDFSHTLAREGIGAWVVVVDLGKDEADEGKQTRQYLEGPLRHGSSP